MIVVETSVFIDAIFEYDENRTALARKLFRALQDTGTQVIEPDVFKVELIGQLVRRMEREGAITLYELIVKRIETIDTAKLKEVAFEIALQTGCRAIDSFYISVAHST
jgi:predicted nucleic acid-binding protein